jgi:O-antigen/teichoic acid export membrane protein
MNVGDVGIYNAYYVASIGVGGLFWGVFNIVYFPAISKYENKGTIFKRINKLLPFLFGFGIPIILIGEFIILKLFGSHYPVNFILMLMFAVSSILVVCYGLFDWTFASQGLRGMKLDNIGTIAIAIVNALLSFILIPRLGLYGAAGAILISFIAGIGCLSLLKRRIS